MQRGLTITIESLQHGQAGSYQDHKYIANITVEGTHSWHRADEDRIKQLAKMFVHPFVEGDEGNWASPRLHALRQGETELLTGDNLGPHRTKWHVEITSPYTG